MKPNTRRVRRATGASAMTVQRILKSQPTSERLERESSLLVIVSCVKRKIWDVDPSAAKRSQAGNAYLGAYFNKNRAYARRFA
jgi:hypothetical protein